MKRIFYAGLSLLMLMGLSVGGYVGYRLYKKQTILEEEILRVMHQGHDTLSNTEEKQVEQLVRHITDPWAELQTKTKDTVVQVFAYKAEFNWLEPYKTPMQGGSTGTGFFIDDQGYLITNAHVVNQARTIFIQVPSLGKEQFEVEIVCFNPDRDLSLLRLKQDELVRLKTLVPSLHYLSLGDSDTVKRGAEVMTLGFPLGQQSLKSTTGIVSGRESVSGRQYIQIDAPINPGNSGGPCLNARGEVIGVNSAKITDAENVGYIIPVNELKLVLPDMYKPKEKLMRRPFLGVFYNASSPAMSAYAGNPRIGGVYVTAAFAGSLLELAGIKPGDMLYAINGHEIDMFGDVTVPGSEDKIALSDYVSFLPLDENFTLSVYRKGKKMNFTIKLALTTLPPIRVKYPEFEPIDYEVIGGMVVLEFARNLLPLLLQSAPELIMYEDPKKQLEPFLIVTNVFSSSQINRTRVIRAGTRLDEVNGKEVRTIEDLRDALRASVDTGYLTIKTMQDIFAVCEFDKIVKEEFDLAAAYKYQPSRFVQQLIQKYVEKHEKKTGSVSSRTATASE